MSEAKPWPLASALSITTGVLLREPFSDVHELAEFLAGFPIWTHQFARKDLWDSLTDAISQQHPNLPTEIDADMRDRWADWLVEQERVFGRTILLKPMPGSAEQRDPIEEAVEMVGADRVTVIAAGQTEDRT